MMIVNTHEAKTRLSELLRLVEERQERIRVCRNGRPIAEISPIPRPSRSPLEVHPLLAQVEFREDARAPLSDADWGEVAQ